MSDRLPERLRAHFASLPVAQRPQFVPPARRRPARLAPIAAAVAVLVLLALAGLWRWEGSSLPAAEGQHPPSLPDEFASYAYSTATVAKSPPGPAIALYQHGYGVELFDEPQLLVVGAHRDVYRQVETAYERADPQDQGDPAPCLLSPDGATVAVGSHRGLGDLTLVDLETGRRQSLPADAGAAYRPLAWSADGRYIAALKLAEFDFNQTPKGQVAIFDLRPDGNGPAYWVTTASGVNATFSPDGREILIDSANSLNVADLTGKTLRTIEAGGSRLRSRSAWSPDGRWIALMHGTDTVWEGETAYMEVRFVDASGGGAAGPQPVPDAYWMLGWAGDHRVIVRSGSVVREVDLDTRRERVLTRTNGFPGENFMTAEIQLATGLLTGLEVRDDAWLPDRGPWPAGYQLVSAVGAAALILLGGLIVGRVRARRRRARIR